MPAATLDQVKVAGITNAWIAIFAFSWCLDRLAALQRPVLNSLIFAGVGAGTETRRMRRAGAARFTRTQST